MTRCNPSKTEIFHISKEVTANRAKPAQTPPLDSNQRTLSGDRIHAGVIRERRKALSDGRFIP